MEDHKYLKKHLKLIVQMDDTLETVGNKTRPLTKAFLKGYQQTGFKLPKLK